MGDKRGSWRVLSSLHGREFVYRDHALAMAAVHTFASRYHSLMLLEYDRQDRLYAAFAFKYGHGRNLDVLLS